MKKSKMNYYFDILLFGVVSPVMLLSVLFWYLQNLYKHSPNLIFVKLINSFTTENLNSFLITLFVFLAIYSLLWYSVNIGTQRKLFTEETAKKTKEFIAKIITIAFCCLFPIVSFNELQFTFFTSVLAFFTLVFAFFKKK